MEDTRYRQHIFICSSKKMLITLVVNFLETNSADQQRRICRLYNVCLLVDSTIFGKKTLNYTYQLVDTFWFVQSIEGDIRAAEILKCRFNSTFETGVEW